MDKGKVQNVRDALKQELVLWRDDFKEKIAKMTNRQVMPASVGSPKIEEESGVYIVF